MRPPIAMIGLAVLLSGCAYASNPFDGFPHYIEDTHGLSINPNSPQGRSENMSLARGEAVNEAPLRTAPGNVWPAPVQAEPTLQDYEKQIENGTFSPETTAPNAAPGTAPATGTAPGTAPLSLGMPAAPKPLTSPPATLGKVAPVTGDVSTTHGTAHVTTDSNGVITYTLTNGTRGIAVANGDGTLTLIGPDGSVETVKAPK